MNWKYILSGAILAACAGMFATEARAILRYDLRFADGTKEKNSVLGVYAVELWGVIDDGGNGTFADERIIGGYANIYSGKIGNGAILGGTGSGVTSAAIPHGVPGLFLGSVLGSNGDTRRDTDNDRTTPADPASADGILDWGSDETYFGLGSFTPPNQALQTYTKAGVNGPNAAYQWSWGPGPAAFIPGGNDAFPAGPKNHPGAAPNTWEVLLGEFTITIAPGAATGTPADRTTFNPWIYHRVRSTITATSAISGLQYQTNGVITSNFSTPIPQGTFRPQDGISFVGIIPEPSTYAIFGLAGLGSISALRRRKC